MIGEKMTKIKYSLTASILIGLSAISMAFAQVPEVNNHNGIDYMTGGIGLDESIAIKEEARHWPVQIMLSEIMDGKAVWIADVDLTVKNANHQTVFEIKTEGPLALIKLEPGKYTVEATNNGVKQTRRFTVIHGASKTVSIFWKASSTDTAEPDNKQEK